MSVREEMLLRRKVSSCYEVTGSQTSGCHSDVSNDSLSVGPAEEGAGDWAVSGVCNSLVSYSWASTTWAQEEVCEGISIVSENTKGTGE